MLKTVNNEVHNCPTAGHVPHLTKHLFSYMLKPKKNK